MAKGVSISFKSYQETVPKLLSLIKFDKELSKHSKIILKPHLDLDASKNTPAAFLEQVLSFCIQHKSAESEIFIAEGVDGADTMDLFEEAGYRKLAEQYTVGLVDLNTVEVEEVLDGEFLKFENIKYPKILFDSFIVSLPKLAEDNDREMLGALSIMTGAFPAKFYSGFFSNTKNKIRKWPFKYAIHDILKCKMPEFCVIDASEKKAILAGIPFEMDKQAAKLLGKDWKNVAHLRLVDERFAPITIPEKTDKKEGKNSENKSEQEDKE